MYTMYTIKKLNIQYTLYWIVTFNLLLDLVANPGTAHTVDGVFLYKIEFYIENRESSIENRERNIFSCILGIFCFQKNKRNLLQWYRYIALDTIWLFESISQEINHFFYFMRL